MIHTTSAAEIRPYLTDASNFPGGHAEGVAFPASEREVVELVQEANAKGLPITVAGGGTGLVGARAPLGGWVLATDRLARIREIVKDPIGKNSWAVAEPGIRLKDFHDSVSAEGLLYPPDPTSGTTAGGNAFLGGTVGTNASGPRSFKYGMTRRFVRRLRVVLPTGDVVSLKRGKIFSSEEGILKIPLSGSTLSIPIPHYAMPPVKNTAGYFVHPKMDAVDLFIGSEGTLGVMTEIETALLAAPPHFFSMFLFFKSEEASWRFAAAARALTRRHEAESNDTAIQARALEYMDGGSLDLVCDKFPEVPKEARAALFIEQECQPETEEMLLDPWYALAEKYGALGESWLAQDETSLARQREFRHEVPAQVRDFLKRYGQSKVGTDMAVPHERLEELLRYQARRLEELKLPNVTFGHIGDAHVHLNILPKNKEEHAQAWSLYSELVTKAIEWGGTVAGEHGIGKLKRPYLFQMFGEKAVAEMAAVKKALDPKTILGRGTLFPESML